MAEQLKVLFLPRWYPHRYDPMPGLFIERHARAVSAHVRVAVLYIHKDERLTKAKMELERFQDEELLQLKIYYRPSRMPFPALKSLINICRYFKYHYHALRMLKREFGKPDIIHVNVLTRLGIIALLYKWLSGTPYVISEHWTRYLPERNSYHGILRKVATGLVVSNASAVMPVTLNLRKAMESHRLRNRNWQVIPNVVDIEMFNLREYRSVRTKKSFIHVSCFEDKQKNISGILRVLKRLSEQRTDWECQMVGEGIHLEKLIGYAKELKIDGSFVFFNGLKENNELAGMMADADFQVMFSRYENLPVVILESFACGVPVLSTDVGGIREHINDERGLLIRSEAEDKLVETISFMLDHYKDFNKIKIRQYAQNNFSKEVIGAKLLEVYSTIVQR